MAHRGSDGRIHRFAAVLSLFLAEFGHQLAFAERFGPRGFALEGAGVHSYFPTLLMVAGGLVGAAALGALFLLSLGRLLVGGALGRTRRPGTPVLPLLALLLALQLAGYLVQETCETLASGQPLTVHWLTWVVAWGIAGQGPVALLAAVALSWLSARLEGAIAAVRRATLPRPLAPAPVEPLRPVGLGDGPYLPLTAVCRTVLSNRGPPVEAAAAG